MQAFSSLITLLSGSSLRIVIIPHHTPDADALGSALGMTLYLQKLGHVITIISPSEYPAFLSWMPGSKDVLQFDPSCARCAKAMDEADLLFFVDMSSINRVGTEMQAAIKKNKAKRALIDHHADAEEGLATYKIWSPYAAATAILVFDLMCVAKHEHLIDKDIAACLYAGILTDTGSFQFSSANARVHYAVGRLMDLGKIDADKISTLLYQNNSVRRVRLLGFALSTCLVVYPEWRTAYFVLKEKDMQHFALQVGDTEGLVNYALSIEGIRLAALIKEVGDEVRVSFRSKGTFPVNKLAKQHFGGGGHCNAAGGSCQAPLDSIVKRFKALLPDYKEALDDAVSSDLENFS